MFFDNPNIRKEKRDDNAGFYERQDEWQKRTFVKTKKIKKTEKNLKKRVDTGSSSWYYIQALAKRGFGRRALERARES